MLYDYTATNHAYGIEARVIQFYKGGYSVTLWDTDAGQSVPVAKVFPTLDQAIEYANSLVKGV